LPNGCAGLYIGRAWWEVTTSFTGGASSAIAITTSNTNYNATGALLGGAGEVAATLVSTGAKYKPGTLGASYAATNGIIVLATADTIVFQRVTSAFTAGAGFVHLDIGYVD